MYCIRKLRVAYSRHVHQLRSILILTLSRLSMCVIIPTLVAALRIGWFIKPFGVSVMIVVFHPRSTEPIPWLLFLSSVFPYCIP
jgi:hypothetical protein